MEVSEKAVSYDVKPCFEALDEDGNFTFDDELHYLSTEDEMMFVGCTAEVRLVSPDNGGGAIYARKIARVF